MSTASPAASAMSGSQSRSPLPPVLGRLLSGTFWLALRGSPPGGFRVVDDPARAGGDPARRVGSVSIRLGIRLLPVPVRVRRELGVAAADLRRLDARRPRGGRSGDRQRDELLRGDGDPSGRGAAWAWPTGPCRTRGSRPARIRWSSSSCGSRRSRPRASASRWSSRACSRRRGGTISCRGSSWRSPCCGSSCWCWA